MRKNFTILKVGYTTGVYGCSGEYFTCIYNNKAGMNSFSFEGMYGVEERVEATLKDRGYQFIYINSDYGKMKYREIPRNFFLSESGAVELAKTL